MSCAIFIRTKTKKESKILTKDRNPYKLWVKFFSCKPSYYPAPIREQHEFCEMLHWNQNTLSVRESGNTPCRPAEETRRNAVGEGRLSLYNLHTSELYEYFLKWVVVFSSINNNKEEEKENDDEKTEEIMHCSLHIFLAHQGISTQRKHEVNLPRLTNLFPAPETIF